MITLSVITLSGFSPYQLRLFKLLYCIVKILCCIRDLLKLGMQQTMQKNSVGFILWDEITGGKDRIPWEKDRLSVLFYAPAPKTHGNFTVFLLTL
jgi:hypothetical protein